MTELEEVLDEDVMAFNAGLTADITTVEYQSALVNHGIAAALKDIA